MPFDRLVHAVDQWAQAHPGVEVIAQIGPTASPPRHVKAVELLEPEEFQHQMQQAEVVVAHAGTGTIITALELGKPIIVMPRRADLRETRNDHQIATAERFAARGLVHVARDETEIPALLARRGELRPAEAPANAPSNELIRTLSDFISGSSAVESAPAERPVKRPS